ncbi:MAG: hypothetical protein WD851_09370 [Pirellulales bacterium]
MAQPNQTESALDRLFRLPVDVRDKVFEVMEEHPELRQLNLEAVAASKRGDFALGEKLAERASRRWYPHIFRACGPSVAALFGEHDSSTN